MTFPIVLVLVTALVSGCATSPSTQPTLTPQAAAPPASGSGTGLKTALSIPAEISAVEDWIEVDLAAQQVRLWEGRQVRSQHAAATGVATTPETTTYPGVYRVQQMIQGPLENVPGVFVSDILIYDIAAGAGIHSMPMDKVGRVSDNRLGEPLTAGCVRVGESADVFKFARLGMTIWIH